MRISRDRLMAESQATGFRPEILEKVIHLLSLLEKLNSHDRLNGKLVLKGGTALNIFLLDVPRLSVDIDLNYVGSADRESLDKDRPQIEQAIMAICAREGYAVTKSPSEHAGGKYRLRYASSVTPTGILQLDINYMYRIPLWPVAKMDSRTIGSHSCRNVSVLDIHEIAAGKFAALLSRHAARDLYDAHRLFDQAQMEEERLRLAFVCYGAINRKDWRTVSVDEVGFDRQDLESQLVPVLRADALSLDPDRDAWASSLVGECREGLSRVLPLRDNEVAFLDLILDQGEVRPELLTDDGGIQDRIRRHPGILWKAANVQVYRRRGASS